MKTLSQALFLVVFSLIFLGVGNTNVHAADILFDEFKDVPVDKVWTITFNQKLDPNTIHNIGVGFNGGEYLDTIEVELSEDGKSVYVRNTEEYRYNSQYVLDIKQNVRSITGESLKEYHYIMFSTKTLDIDTSDQEWEKFDTGDDFLIYIDSQSLKSGYKYLYNDAETIFDSIESYLQYDVTDKMNVYIDSLNERQAYYSGGDHHFFINPFKLFGGDIRYHFAHESVHAVTHKKWGIGSLMEGYTDNWLVEGIAEYVSKHHVDFPPCNNCGNMKDLKYDKNWYIKNFSHRGVNVVKNVNNFFDLDNTIQEYGDYLAYESMVYFLVNKYGESTFFNTFIDNKIKYKNTGQTLEKTYQKSESEIISEWKNYYSIN